MIATYADTTVDFGYDGDWGSPPLWAPYTYDYTEYQVRHRSTGSLEMRLTQSGSKGLSWLIGVYALELHEDLNDTSKGLYIDPFDATQNSLSQTVVQSEYRATNSALYAELDGDFGARTRWSLGLRGERRTTHYDDETTNLDAPTLYQFYDPENNLWGGHASLDYTVATGKQIYALIARGYKAGGFNLSPGLPENQLLFGPENDLNYEVGLKALLADGRLRSDTSIFYTQRRNEQLLTGEQLQPDDPNTFIFYTGNARSGYNYGLESSLAWRAQPSLSFGGSLGLLQTLYRGFVQNGVLFPDRALPHAPAWQAALDAEWRDPKGPFARLDVTGMGAFFYDLPPNWTRSNSYGLVNARIGWATGRTEIAVWDATCSTRTTPYAAFISATSRRTSPTRSIPSWASRAISACTSRSATEDRRRPAGAGGVHPCYGAAHGNASTRRGTRTHRGIVGTRRQHHQHGGGRFHFRDACLAGGKHRAVRALGHPDLRNRRRRGIDLLCRGRQSHAEQRRRLRLHRSRVRPARRIYGLHPAVVRQLAGMRRDCRGSGRRRGYVAAAVRTRRN